MFRVTVSGPREQEAIVPDHELKAGPAGGLRPGSNRARSVLVREASEPADHQRAPAVNPRELGMYAHDKVGGDTGPGIATHRGSWSR
jgi:hypothetical protein